MLSYEIFSDYDDDDDDIITANSEPEDCGPDVWLDPCNPADPCDPDYGGICEPDCDPTENDFDCWPYE